MAKRKEEVVCSLPFTPKKSTSYGFIVRGNLVVLENGVPRHKTAVPADPDSNYRVEGNKVIRSFVPGAREKLSAQRDASGEIMKSSDFLCIVCQSPPSWGHQSPRSWDRAEAVTTAARIARRAARVDPRRARFGGRRSARPWGQSPTSRARHLPDRSRRRRRLFDLRLQPRPV